MALSSTFVIFVAFCSKKVIVSGAQYVGGTHSKPGRTNPHYAKEPEII